MNKVLLLEDDISLVDGLKYSLEKKGFMLDIARTISEVEVYLSECNKYDLILLDVTLPDGTGFEICEQVRNRGDMTPIIFLTASDEEINIIRGLDSGGDDYITKPFRLGELYSRINALLRRAGITQNNDDLILNCGDITIDYIGNRVLLNNKVLELTSIEYRLICLLIRNVNKVVSRNFILNELWDGMGNFIDDNTLSVHIRRLREKIEDDPSYPKHLVTVRGFGYKWKEVM